MLSNEVFDKVYTIVKYAMGDLEIEVNGESVPKWADKADSQTSGSVSGLYPRRPKTIYHI